MNPGEPGAAEAGGAQDHVPPPVEVTPTDAGAQGRTSAPPENPPEAVPQNRTDRWAHRRAEPRPLALLWTTFLAAATLIMLTSLVMHGGADHDIYRPAARALLAVTAVGMTILWPMVRLSQDPPPEGARAAIAKDLVVILAPVQAVLWPQMFFVLAHWPVNVIGALAVMLLAWNLLVGAVVVLAIDSAAAPGRGSGTRAAWMAAIVALVTLGPVIGLLTHTAGNPSPDDPGVVSAWALSSPITAVFEIARDRPWSGAAAETRPAHWAAIGVVGGIALLAWAAVLAIPTRRAARPAPPEPSPGMV